MYTNIHKRFLDLILLTFAFFFCSPLLLITAILVYLKLGSPILFCQMRPGLHGQPFKLYKFRTMTNTKNTEGIILPDANRLTPFGRFLRSTSLDELPELFNVYKGDMRFIGPRPLLMAYLKHYTPSQMRRHSVKPGITGWAQINGRNAISWNRKFALDVWYVDHCSFWLDLKIFALTIWKVFTRKGISHPGQVTMEEFKG